jgi:hypothetical protein
MDAGHAAVFALIRYRATVRHPDIRGARYIDCGCDFAAAQKRAELEFRNERLDAEIVIEGFRPKGAPEIYASKYVGAADWIDC